MVRLVCWWIGMRNRVYSDVEERHAAPATNNGAAFVRQSFQVTLHGASGGPSPTRGRGGAAFRGVARGRGGRGARGGFVPRGRPVPGDEEVDLDAYFGRK